MRSILAGAVSLTLSLGSLIAQSPSSSASLGRPVPAASLGRPAALTNSNGEKPFQPAAYRAERPAGATTIVPVESAPLLAPIASAPADEPLPQPRPMPSDGGPGSTAVPPPGSSLPRSGSPSFGPSYGPVAPAPGLGCASGNCGGLGDPAMGGMYGPYGFAFGDPGSRFYTSLDFLMLWVPDITTPLPIAQASPNPFTPGAPFPAGTTVAIGNTDLISNLRIGARFGAGLWFDPCHLGGLDGSFFFVGPTSRDLAAVATGTTSLFRPYVVINLPGNGTAAPPATVPNFADIVANPPGTGSVHVHTDSFLMGGDLNYRRRLFSCCCSYLDLLVGFRYMHLDESITITESGTPTAQGPTFSATDRFRTINNFYGWQIGTIAHKEWGPWSADLLLKIAMGPTPSIVEITGSNNFAANRAIGLFAQDSNIGRYQSSNFSIVPEIGLNLGYQVTPRMSLHIGYTGIYWSNVLRPGEQIDPIIDQTKVPVPPGSPVPVFLPLAPADPHPVIPFKRSDYFAHGLNFGVTFRW